jgi:arabinofuranosyltransferase
MTSQKTSPLRIVLLAGFLIAILFGMTSFMGFVVDDSYISFRYAENLAHGNGLVFNPGERVEGYSNLLWVLMLSLASKMRFRMVEAAQTMGYLFGVLGVFLVWFLRPGKRGWPLPLLLATSLPWLIWSVAGLETALYAVLLIGTAICLLRLKPQPNNGQNKWWLAAAGLLAALMVWTRPEGIMLALACGLAMALDERKIPRRTVFLWMAIPLAAWALQAGFRLFYYDDIFPNTYYAKDGWLLGRGVKRYTRFLLERGLGIVFLLPVLAGFIPAWRRRPGALLAAAVFLAQSFFILKVGGDWMVMHRFFVPLLPFMFLLWVVGVEELCQRLRRPLLPVTILLGLGLIITGLWGRPEKPGLDASLWHYAHRYTNAYQKGLENTSIAVGQGLTGIVPSDFRIALGDVGALPYYSHLRVIDLYGLVNPKIAHLPGHAQYFDEKDFDVGSILAERPELFYLNSRNPYQLTGEPFKAFEHLKIDGLIFNHPDFQENYERCFSAQFSGQWCHLFVLKEHKALFEAPPPRRY